MKTSHPIVSRAEWLAARRDLLEHENLPNLLQDEPNSARFPKVAQAFLPVVFAGIVPAMCGKRFRSDPRG